MVSDWFFYWQEEIQGRDPRPLRRPYNPRQPHHRPPRRQMHHRPYYTSSYHTATYWYPASCSGWQSLSKAYLEAFPTLQDLQAKYPRSHSKSGVLTQ